MYFFIKVVIFITITCNLQAEPYAQFYKNPFANGKTLDSYNKPHKVYTKKEAKVLLGDFMFITGENELNFNKMIELAVSDKDWQEAENTFRNDFKEIDIHGSRKVIPEWKKALDLYRKSVIEKHNVLSAFEGLSILEKYFMGMEGGDEIRKNVIENNLPIFAHLLAEKGYCYGYFYSVKSAVKYEKKLELGLQYGNEGFPVCAKQFADKKIPFWIDLEFRKSYVQAKQLKRLKDSEIK